MEIRLILLDIIDKGLDNKHAIEYMRSKGFSEVAARYVFHTAGITFPVKDFDERNPSLRRKEQLQIMSLQM